MNEKDPKVRSLCTAGMLALLVAGLPAAALAQDAEANEDAGSTADAASATAAPGSIRSAAARHVLRQKEGLAPAEADEADSRVYGGRPSEPGAWPWQVALMSAEKLDGSPEGRFEAQFCGGSLIARQWVLTAAHCVVSEEGVSPPEAIGVLTGTNRVSKGGEIRRVAEVIPHEDYQPQTINNDIALLKLAEPIQGSGGPVGAVALAEEEQPPEGGGIVSGWGKLEDGKFPDQLMEAEIDLVGSEVCNKGLMDLYARELAEVLLAMGGRLQVPEEGMQQAFEILIGNASPPITDAMLCAGTESGERDACSGDSGGPLVVRRQDGSFRQVGVVSWGQGPLSAEVPCGHPQLYGVYTRVSKFFPWIRNHVVGSQ